MNRLRLSAALLAFFIPAYLPADVVSAGPGGFTTQHEILIAADRATTWHAAVNNVGQWWSDDHTVAGNAGRMRIDPRPLGCFCEYLSGDDGVVHLVVTSVSTNVMLRMTGGLGPLGLMGVNGNMTWEFFDDVAGTRVRFTYAVGGYRDGGLDAVAEPVDYVIGEALGFLKEFVEAE
ncbi:MAG: ATPase [Woeseiaceae bacterium]|nr:ATPase [Woeseiaceae bacterium]